MWTRGRSNMLLFLLLPPTYSGTCLHDALTYNCPQLCGGAGGAAAGQASLLHQLCQVPPGRIPELRAQSGHVLWESRQHQLLQLLLSFAAAVAAGAGAPWPTCLPLGTVLSALPTAVTLAWQPLSSTGSTEAVCAACAAALYPGWALARAGVAKSHAGTCGATSYRQHSHSMEP